MTDKQQADCTCGTDEILEHIGAEDLLELGAGERLWKLYCFRTLDHPTGLRHRIYTKRKRDGRLALITFAVHNPPRNGDGNGPAVRSAIARVPDLSTGDLDRLIGAIRQQTASDACELLDLSDRRSLEEQLALLEQRSYAEGGADVFEPGGD